MNTSERIRALCKDRGISVKALEAELGFGNGSLTKGSSIRSDRLVQVAKYLGVSPEFLLTGAVTTIDTETAKIAKIILENKTARLIVENLPDLSDKEKTWVLEAIQFIKRKSAPR